MFPPMRLPYSDIQNRQLGGRNCLVFSLSSVVVPDSVEQVGVAKLGFDVKFGDSASRSSAGWVWLYMCVSLCVEL